MLNLSSLFYSTAETPTLVDSLDLSEDQREFIVQAKTSVRSRLKAELPATLRLLGHDASAVEPRFFTQGSWAYKTLNAPARTPQQADIDDGAYLPLSFVARTGKPSEASAIFFRAGEAVLSRLARELGWKLVSTKPTCMRLEIAPFAHLDIPLYAIPDIEFSTLEKAAAQRARLDARGGIVIGEAEEDVWTNLPTNSVLLAHREEDWLRSDPRPIKRWFLSEVERHGEQFRRVVRVLKAFRDWQWASGGPASILLMVAAGPVFETRDRRDDLALLDLVRELPAALRAGVCNPADRSESLTDRLGASGVEDAARRLENLENILRDALHGASPDSACRAMVSLFGPRFPNEPARVKIVSATSTISATPAIAVPSPLIGRTKAG